MRALQLKIRESHIRCKVGNKRWNKCLDACEWLEVVEREENDLFCPPSCHSVCMEEN